MTLGLPVVSWSAATREDCERYARIHRAHSQALARQGFLHSGEDYRRLADLLQGLADGRAVPTRADLPGVLAMFGGGR